MSRVAPKTGEKVALDPQRLFSPKQRLQILLASNGRCARCGVKLGKDWQADHVLAWSQGGRTEVGNGEAIGPECYSKKNADDTTRAAKTKRQAKLTEPREASKRPLQSRGFDKTLRKRMNGTVERRTGARSADLSTIPGGTQHD